MRSASGVHGPEGLDRCFLRGGLWSPYFASSVPDILIWLICGEEFRRLSNA